jgi:hypothetical protein
VEYRLLCSKEELEKIQTEKSPVEDPAPLDAKILVDELWRDAAKKQAKYEDFLLLFETHKMREQDQLMVKEKLFANINFSKNYTERMKVVEQLRITRKRQTKEDQKIKEQKHAPIAEGLVNLLFDFAWRLEKGEVVMGDLVKTLCP